MASLTETSILSRKLVRFTIYGLILFVIGRYTFKFAIELYQRMFPKPPPEATVEFGKLPPLPFPEKEFPENVSFKLETAEGTLPAFPIQAPVYVMPPIPSNLQALDEAKAKARTLGFNPNGRLLVESIPNIYVFRNDQMPSILTMNIISGIFSISFDLSQDSKLLGVPSAPDPAIQQVKSYMNSSGILAPDLSDGNYIHQFLKVENRQFVPVISLSEANLIKINVFRKNYGTNAEFPSLTPEFPDANVWFVLGGINIRQAVAAEYQYFPIESENSATYPLKTSDIVWDELQQGQAYIANMGDNEREVTIRRVYIGYYDAGQYQEYYQPIAVFEGDNGFIAYVPAVTGEFYGSDE